MGAGPVSGLADLGPLLTLQERDQALTEALAAVRAIKYLAALVPHLTPEERDRALTGALAAVRAIKYEEDRSEALTALHLTPRKRAIGDKGAWSRVVGRSPT